MKSFKAIIALASASLLLASQSSVDAAKDIEASSKVHEASGEFGAATRPCPEDIYARWARDASKAGAKSGGKAGAGTNLSGKDGANLDDIDNKTSAIDNSRCLANATYTLNSIDLRDIDASSALDALSFLPSVETTQPYADSIKGEVFIRGLGSEYNSLYIDGVPMDGEFAAGTDYLMTPLLDAASLSVTSGYISTLLSTSTMGSVISLTTKKPKAPFELSALASYLTPTAHKELLSLGGRYTSWWYKLAASNLMRAHYDVSRGFHNPYGGGQSGLSRHHSALSRQSLLAKVGFTPNERDEYILSLSYLHGSRDVPSAPGVGNSAHVINISDNAGTKNGSVIDNKNNPAYTRLPKIGQLVASLSTTSYVNEMLSINSLLYYRGYSSRLSQNLEDSKEGLFSVLSSALELGDTYGMWLLAPDSSSQKESEQSAGARLELLVRPSMRDRVGIVLGFKYDARRIEERQSLKDEKHTLKEVDMRYTDARYTPSIGLEYTHSFSSALELKLGASYSANIFGAQEESSHSENKSYKQDRPSMHSYNIGAYIGYTPCPILSLYASLSKKDGIALMPSSDISSVMMYINQAGQSNTMVINQVTNYAVSKHLRPESAIGPEVGVRIVPISGEIASISLRAALYYNALINAYVTNYSGNATAPSLLENSSTAYSRAGLELGLASSFYHDIFTLGLEYSYTYYPEALARLHASHLFSFVAKVAPLRMLDIVIAGRYASTKGTSYMGSTLDSKEIASGKEVFILDARLDIRPRVLRGVSFALGVRNATDSSYHVASPTPIPMPGVSGYVGIGYDY